MNKWISAAALALVIGPIGLASARKSGNSGNTVSARPYVDQVCIDFCDDYFFTYCSSSNIYLNPTKRGNRSSKQRDLVVTNEDDQPRANDFSDETAAIEECQATCMLWPRGQDPATFTDEDDLSMVFNSNLGGDTIWCRRRHMSLATDLNSAAFHCPHASNPSMGICRDSLVNGYSPYELLRAGQKTRYRLGYCDMANGDTVADCTNVGITDATLPDALDMLPSTVEVIFMNGNSGITELPGCIFADNLSKPKILQAIYVNDCSIATIDADALNGLPNLKVFNADVNSVSVLPEDLFEDNPQLLQFSMFNNALTDIPAGLFQNTLSIERIVLYGMKGLTSFNEGTFDGLTKLQMLSFVNCGFSSFPPGLFSDLVSLQFFDFFGNELTSFDASWFDGGWGSNIIRLAFWNIPTLVTVDENAFDTLESLEVAYFHGTGVSYIDTSLFTSKPFFTHLTI